MDEERDRPNKPTLISNAVTLPLAPHSLDGGMVAYPKEWTAVIDFSGRSFKVDDSLRSEH